MTYLLVACGVVLTGVFATSAASKLRGRAAFAEFVTATARIGGFRPDQARPMAMVVAGAEAAIVLGFITAALAASRVLAGLATAGSALLLAVFTGAIVRAMRRGAAVPCRCFGASKTPLGRRHLVRNAVLLVAAALGLATALAAGSAPVHPAGLAVAAGAGVLVAILAIATDEIADLFAYTARP